MRLGLGASLTSDGRPPWHAPNGSAVTVRCAQTGLSSTASLPQAYEEAKELYRRHRGLIDVSSRRSEWPNLRTDLLELSAPAPVAHRLRTAQRVVRTYSIFQQPTP